MKKKKEEKKPKNQTLKPKGIKNKQSFGLEKKKGMI